MSDTNAKSLTLKEAIAASNHAQEVIRSCDNLEDLDQESGWKYCFKNCPEGFTEAQKNLAQIIILREYERRIGRR